MSWPVVLGILALEVILGLVISALLNQIAIWLSGFSFIAQCLANRWLLMGINLVAIFVLPWMLCGGLALLAIQLQSRFFATATLVIGFSSIILIPFFYAALLTRLRRIQNLTNQNPPSSPKFP